MPGVDCLTDEVDLVVSALEDALEQELLEIADLDRAIRNIFGVRMRLGQLDQSGRNPYASIPESTADGQVISLEAEGILVAVPEDSAPTAAEFVHQDWGSGSHTLRSVNNHRYVSLTEQGVYQANAPEIGGWFVKEVVQFETQSDGSNILRTWNSIPVGMSEHQGHSALSPVSPQAEPAVFEIDIVARGIEQAVEAARDSQASVVVVGNSPYINGKEEIDRPSLLLPPNQVELVKAVCEANPNTVVVIMGSYPFALQELKGHYAPAGRLNMTWYADESQLPDIMDYDIIQNGMTYMYHQGPIQYAFGHGLTYSEFEYEAIRKLALWDVTRDRYCLETATWAILAGRSSADIRQSADIQIEEVFCWMNVWKDVRQFGQSPGKNLCIAMVSHPGSLSTITLFRTYKDLKPEWQLMGKRADWRFVLED
ncbi:hypothetical protein HK101_003540 [Irineochytrium annulatum]|nr:hypothetical protein HK101_003540 [Irineochytrium annulatum]